MTLPKLKSLPILPTAWVVFLLTVAGLTTIITWVTLQTRSALRDDILSRDANNLALLVDLEMDQAQSQYPELSNPIYAELMLGEVLLNTASYEGVLAVALYSSSGEWVESLPYDFPLKAPPSSLMTDALLGTPSSIFIPEGKLSQFLASADTNTSIPLLAVTIPMAGETADSLQGIGYYLLEGNSIEQAFAQLDQKLTTQGLGALSGGAILFGLILGAAFTHLFRVQKRLDKKSVALAQATGELNLALKSNALGSLTAQLLHDFKSPLSGLKYFVEDRLAETTDSEVQEDSEEALAYIRRMQATIQEVVDALQDAGLDQEAEMTWEEFSLSLQNRVREANFKGINLYVEPAFTGAIDGNRANILLMILFNLVQNAWEASEPDSLIQVGFQRGKTGQVKITVLDCGGGLNEHARSNLFKPQLSSKSTGSGIGLALSHQLAQRVGADLNLVHTSPKGSCFSIEISPTVLEAKAQPQILSSP